MNNPPIYRMDKFSLPEGDVIIHFPFPLSAESQVMLEEFIKLFVRKTNRVALTDPPKGDERD
jgi:hypothetical protein